MNKKLVFTLLLLMVSGTANAFQNSDPVSGTEVLQMMHDEYSGKWYQNLTFTQETIFYGRNGNIERTQMWYETMSLPGKLAIKFDEKQSGNGILFRDGKQYGFANGQKIQESERVHELLVLGFDVYHQSVDETANQLSGNGYDLEKMYKDEWQGREVFVVGVSEPDTNKAQFWIDAERLVFVRNFTIGRGGTIQEVQFNNYEKLGEGWIAPEVIFKANGQMGLLEKYSEVKTPESVNMEIFDPEKFVEAKWE